MIRSRPVSTRFTSRRKCRSLSWCRAPSGAQRIEGAQLHAQDFAIQEHECIERLILRTAADVSIHGEVSQKLFDFGGAHSVRMAQVMEANELLDPSDVALFGAVRIVLESERMPALIEELNATLAAKGGGIFWRQLELRGSLSDAGISESAHLCHSQRQGRM